MDKFEQQFENLDVKSSHVEQAMSDVTTLTVPQVSYYFPLLRFQPKGWLKVACEQQTHFVCHLQQARLKVVCLKKFCSISFFKKSLRQWHCWMGYGLLLNTDVTQSPVSTFFFL